MQASERVIVALDFGQAAQAHELVAELGETAQHYKVWLQMLTAEGPGLIRQLISQGKQVFLDLKLHEIPTSVARAVTAAGALGVTMVSVHAMGGSAVLRAAVEAARSFPELRVLALTVITSLDDRDLSELGIQSSVDEQVMRLARLAVAAGCHGVIASPREARVLRSALPEAMLIVTPGAQLRDATASNHVRTATPGEAIEAGATHLIVGRSLVTAQSPRATFAAICREIAQASAPRATL